MATKNKPFKSGSAYTLPERKWVTMCLLHSEHKAAPVLGINPLPVLCDISTKHDFTSLCLLNILHANTSFLLCVPTARSVSAPLNTDTKKPKGVGQWALSHKEMEKWHLAECRKECANTRMLSVAKIGLNSFCYNLCLHRLTQKAKLKAKLRKPIRMTAKEFFSLVSRMRTAQKNYFNLRSQQSLQDSKSLERQVDAEIERVNNILNEQQNPKLW